MKKILLLFIFLGISLLLFGWQEEEPFYPAPTEPAWSPLGDKIAFVVSLSEGEVADIYVINTDGTGLTRLTTGGATSPVWSPDGAKIYYKVWDQYGLPHIYVMNADGSNPQRLTNNEEDVSIGLSRDGKYMYVLCERGPILCSSNGEEVKLLSPQAGPSFSPDGKWTVSAARAREELDDREDTTWKNIWVLNLETFQSYPITTGHYDDSAPKWSPTGEWIVFHSDRPDHPPSSTGRQRIWLVRPDGSDLHTLFDYSQLPPDVNDSDPDWSPDGQWIVFVREAGVGDWNLWIASVDGTQVYKLTNFTIASLPDRNKKVFASKDKLMLSKKEGRAMSEKGLCPKNESVGGSTLDKNRSHKEVKLSPISRTGEQIPSNAPRAPLLAGGLSLTALGYVLWKFLKILG
ncbi:PD40 domain-containing protein [bacterium]|nr:PD40 domain-containing protein [bacterium]